MTFATDEEVQELNRKWLGKDRATNVLSFPMAEEHELAGAQLLGDVILAHGVCAAEAADKDVPEKFRRYYKLLLDLFLTASARGPASGSAAIRTVAPRPNASTSA